MERGLAIIASLITIVNYVVVFPSAIFETWVPLEIVSSMTVPTKLVIVVFLELSLAYAFGYLFGLGYKQNDLNQFIIFVLAGFFSAWLTVFNFESLLIGHQLLGEFEYMGFFMMLVIAWLVAVVMISGHIELVSKDMAAAKEATNEAASIQALAFGFLYISLLFR